MRLVIRCGGDTTDAFVLWSETQSLSLRGTSEGFQRHSEWTASVTIQIGDEAPQTSDWGVSPDDRATIVPERMLAAFVTSLEGAERLSASVVPDSRQAIRAVFDVRGLRQALEPVRERCAW